MRCQVILENSSAKRQGQLYSTRQPIVQAVIPFMAIPLLICDDSAMARKQVARSLPQGWDVDITYASNGLQAVEAIRQGKGDIVFLDLTMPEMDGFGVLETIRDAGLKAMVIVISGDIQPVARERVLQLGAITFIKKPVNEPKLREILETYGLL